jgi:23S rRNA (pseudouridine1915-N3)-methyltransferase
MYPVTFLVFGRPRLEGVEGLEAHYSKLLRSHVRLELVELPESRSGDTARRLKEEAKGLRPHLAKARCAVLLDAAGPFRTSEGFAGWLAPRLDRGDSLAFALGSSEGFDPALKAEVGEKLSLSPMTFPHDLARVLFLEQLYRAFSILKGGPYHK